MNNDFYLLFLNERHGKSKKKHSYGGKLKKTTNSLSPGVEPGTGRTMLLQEGPPKAGRSIGGCSTVELRELKQEDEVTQSLLLVLKYFQLPGT
jgi:hypothetical protein